MGVRVEYNSGLKRCNGSGCLCLTSVVCVKVALEERFQDLEVQCEAPACLIRSQADPVRHLDEMGEGATQLPSTESGWLWPPYKILAGHTY